MEQILKKSFLIKAAVVIVIVLALSIASSVRNYSKVKEKLDEKNKYSEEVTARVSDIDELIPVSADKNADTSHIYKFYYTFTYNGEEYAVRSFDEVKDKNKYKIGDETKLMIEPDNPKEFYDPATSQIDDVEDLNIGQIVKNVLTFVIIGAVVIALFYHSMQKKIAAAKMPPVPGGMMPNGFPQPYSPENDQDQTQDK